MAVSKFYSPYKPKKDIISSLTHITHSYATLHTHTHTHTHTSANVGRKGRIIPFCQYPLENAIPQIVNLPSSNSEYVKSTFVEVGLGRHISAESGNTMPFLVAYSW